jgi:Aminotransferase class-III
MAAPPPELLHGYVLSSRTVEWLCNTASALLSLCSCVQVELIDRLLDVTPPSLTRFFFANSGSEVVENAVKLARGHTKRTNVISFDVSVLLSLQHGHCARSQVAWKVDSPTRFLHALLGMPEALHVASSEHPHDNARAGWVPWAHLWCDGADNVKSGLPAGLCATHGRGEQHELRE